MIKRLALVGALAAATAVSAAVKFPYPQAHAYPYASNIADIWNCAGQNASSMLLKHFETYMKDYYEEQGDVARIKFDEKNRTVSEGIGYGMLMCVYFSSDTKSYQTQFDKLWAYYKKNMNGNGVMNWNIGGFGGAIGTGGATDAEEDAAVALIMAYYQFGDSKYLTDASTLIDNMRKSEFSSNGMHKLGDQWDPYKNPSYVSPAAYELYKAVDNGNSSFWSSALTTNYNLLKKNQHPSTGIPSGWADNNSFAPINGNNGYNFTGYDYDAARAPWRWAWSYAWYGHSDAKDLSSKLATWVNSRPFGQLYINMKVDGTVKQGEPPCSTNGCKANGTSIGTLSSVLIIDDQYKDKLNANYAALMSQEAGYFHSSLRLLTGLLMTGNMQNLATATPEPAKTFTIPEDACKDTTTLYVNSGDFGWNSTSVVLSNESIDGVHMSRLIQGDHREVYREVKGIEAGKTYTYSFEADQTEGSELWLTYGLYSDAEMQTKICGAMREVTQHSFTCEFTAAASGSVYASFVLNNWDEPEVTISKFSIKESSGVELVNPENVPVVSIGAVAQARPSLNVSVAGRIASVELSSQMAAQVSVMDMQGRVVVSSVKAEAGKAEVSLAGLRQGKYLVNVRQGASHWTRAIVVAE